MASQDLATAGFRVDDGRYLDLMSYLASEYAKEVADGTVVFRESVSLQAVQHFVAWSQKKIASDPPIGQRYAGKGISLILQSGITVSLQVQDADPGKMKDVGMPITKPTSLVGQGHMPDAGAVSITGSGRREKR